MGLHKGQTNNKQGRKKGTSNKTTKEIRDVLQLILSKEFENIPNYLDQIKEPERKMYILIKLLPFILPVYERIDIETTNINDSGLRQIIIQPVSPKIEIND